MRLRIFFLLCLALLEVQAKQPNVVIIIADDQGWGDLGVHGNTNVHTPHLDALAGSGARMNNFYVAPVCAPTRASLLTGRYHRRTGVTGVSRAAERMNLDEVTLADVFKKAGYATGAFGKWHNGSVYPYHPNGRGFDEFFGFCCGHWGHYFDPSLEHNGRPVQAKGFIADVFTDRAIDYIEKKSGEKEPFLCWLAYCTPHSPFQVAEADWAKIADRDLSLKNREAGKENEIATRAALALVENIDGNVGRLVAKLDQLGVREDTIVIYLSDNGPNTWRWNDGMRGKKGSVDEGGVRAPFFLSWSGTVKPSVIETTAAHIDLLPTLCDLCEVPLPSKNPLDGRSIKPLLMKGGKGWEARPLLSNWRSRVSIRTDRYRATQQGLYDLVEDPGQLTNLAQTKKEVHADLVEQMKRFMEDSALAARPTTHHVGFREFPFVTLNAQEALFVGKGLKYSSIHPNASWIQNWRSTTAWPAWEVEVVEAGDYEVSLRYACAEDAVGTKLEISMGEAVLQGTITEAFDPEPYAHHDRVKRSESYDKPFKVMKLGTLRLKKGPGTISVKALTKPGERVMDLRALYLERK